MKRNNRNFTIEIYSILYIPMLVLIPRPSTPART